MRQFKMLLFKSMTIFFSGYVVLFLSGCGGGISTPSDDDNISIVKVTDLRLGYLVKGIIRADEGEDYRYDLEFCNEILSFKIIFDSNLIEDYYGEGTYEISGESVIVYANGEAMIDTGDSGALEEGKTYIIEQSKGDLKWYVGSISLVNCSVEPI